MKIYKELEQGTEEWFDARAGLLTASHFKEVLTPTGRASKQASKRADICIGEKLAGCSLENGYENFYMKRGKDLEHDAREAYEFLADRDVQQVGFVENHGVGCSPDGLVGGDGLVEIKCLSVPKIIDCYRNGYPKKYKPQIQGQIWVCEREWCDIMIYHPKMQPYTERVEAEEEYIEKLKSEVEKFLEMVDKGFEELKNWKV
jgi:hypothetical protein